HHHAASRPQSGLDVAVYLVRHRRPRLAHAFWPHAFQVHRSEGCPMNKTNFQKYLPHIAVGLTIAWFGYCAYPRTGRADDYNYRDFGKLKVYDGGRLKPIDTVA